MPLPDVGWTGSRSFQTLDDTGDTYPGTSTPGAVTVSVQIIVKAVPVEFLALVLLSSRHIDANIGRPLFSCCSGGLDCD